MKRIFLLFLIFTCATASAQVYRRTGPDGQVYFSDRPGPDAEKVDVTPAQAISLPPVPEQADTTAQPGTGTPGQQEEAASLYTEFNIVSPASEEAVRANDGNVTVQLSLQPELATGHTITLKIDGEDGKGTRSADSMAIELNNLSRGRHSVEAMVIDDQGRVLIQAGPVSFHVLRVAR
ncbi:MAG: DUF4124 domain-containing protein [Gammaproteobacteria bacterium]|nr:MAG: DUF4124 domain-containing protein [Gammaproteobacteria bacterium]